MKKLLYFIGEDKAFLSHRVNLALAAKKAGFDVHVVTYITSHKAEIQKLGFHLHGLMHFQRGGMNPFKDLLCLFELVKLYLQIKPDVVHHVAWKPVLYGSIASLLTRVPKVVNALTGMGYLFISPSLKARILRGCVGCLLPNILRFQKHMMIVQNPDDKELAKNCFRISPQKIRLIRGSGVDTSKYKSTPPPKGRLKFVCVARMLWDKGIHELVEATRIAKLTHANFDVILCGDTDPENPAAIPPEKLKEWSRQGLITWKGHIKDVANIYKNAHVAVLPSYREGLPKSLLEAASCGLPIITTDAPGCREIVRENRNGFLVPIKDPRKLAEAMGKMIKSAERRKKFGLASRDMVEKYFSDEIIISKTMRLYGKP